MADGLNINASPGSSSAISTNMLRTSRFVATPSSVGVLTGDGVGEAISTSCASSSATTRLAVSRLSRKRSRQMLKSAQALSSTKGQLRSNDGKGSWLEVPSPLCRLFFYGSFSGFWTNHLLLASLPALGSGRVGACCLSSVLEGRCMKLSSSSRRNFSGVVC